MGGITDAVRRAAGLPPYQPGQAGPGPASGKLSSNEAPFGPAPQVLAAVAAAAARIGRYPDEAAAHQQLATHIGIPARQLLLANGSDELCHLIAALFLRPGRVAVLGEPCYQIDATVSTLAGAALRPVPLRDGGHDLPAMAKAARDASVVWLPSPHNPTGVACDPAELAGFLHDVPTDCVVVLDEAYRAYADPGLQPDSLALLGRHQNLVIQRSLSKEWALAGLRAGYAIAAEPIISALARARAPFSVNVAALAALQAAVGQARWRDMTVARIRAERSRLEAELRRLGIGYFPSQANFVTAEIEHSVVAPTLAEQGLAVRDGKDLGIPGSIRISVGWAPAMATVRGVLKQVHQIRSPDTRSGTCRPASPSA